MRLGICKKNVNSFPHIWNKNNTIYSIFPNNQLLLASISCKFSICPISIFPLYFLYNIIDIYPNSVLFLYISYNKVDKYPTRVLFVHSLNSKMTIAQSLQISSHVRGQIMHIHTSFNFPLHWLNNYGSVQAHLPLAHQFRLRLNNLSLIQRSLPSLKSPQPPSIFK